MALLIVLSIRDDRKQGEREGGDMQQGSTHWANGRTRGQLFMVSEKQTVLDFVTMRFHDNPGGFFKNFILI